MTNLLKGSRIQIPTLDPIKLWEIENWTPEVSHDKGETVSMVNWLFLCLATVCQLSMEGLTVPLICRYSDDRFEKQGELSLGFGLHFPKLGRGDDIHSQPLNKMGNSRHSEVYMPCSKIRIFKDGIFGRTYFFYLGRPPSEGSQEACIRKPQWTLSKVYNSHGHSKGTKMCIDHARET